MSFESAPPTTLPGTFRVAVRNTGQRAGDEVVMLFFSALDVPATAPAHKVVRQLADFTRVSVAAGRETTLSFTVTADQLALFDADGARTLYGGRYRLVFTNGAGSSAEADIILPGDTRVLAPFPHLLG